MTARRSSIDSARIWTAFGASQVHVVLIRELWASFRYVIYCINSRLRPNLTNTIILYDVVELEAIVLAKADE